MRRAIRPFVSRPLLALAIAVVPCLYLAYMWLVWKTSRIEDRGFGRFQEIRGEHGGIVAMLWHEEVFSVAWAYRMLHAHTLASVGDSGEVITRMLELCNFVVFRGGSSERKSRRREEILGDMIAHMKATRNVAYGITVDGSKGPVHVVKPGAAMIARECDKPLVLVRTWARWNLILPTWDRMAIPLPFNHIRQYLRGPYEVPPESHGRSALEAFLERVAGDLDEMAAESRRFSRVEDATAPPAAPAPSL